MVSSDRLLLFDFAKAAALIKRTLLKADVKWAIGAFDFSWNVDASGRLPPRWSVHTHLMVSGDRRQIKKAMAKVFRPSAYVSRPTWTTEMQPTAFRISYPFKDFYVSKRKPIVAGEKVQDARLPVAQKLRLYTTLDLLTFSGRLIMFRVRFGTEGNLTDVSGRKRQDPQIESFMRLEHLDMAIGRGFIAF
jgi:hypothetical protein